VQANPQTRNIAMFARVSDTARNTASVSRQLARHVRPDSLLAVGAPYKRNAGAASSAAVAHMPSLSPRAAGQRKQHARHTQRGGR